MIHIEVYIENLYVHNRENGAVTECGFTAF